MVNIGRKKDGSYYPKSVIDAHRKENGKVEIFNIHTKQREEFDDVKIKKVGKNQFRIEAETEEGKKVSEFIRVV